MFEAVCVGGPLDGKYIMCFRPFFTADIPVELDAVLEGDAVVPPLKTVQYHFDHKMEEMDGGKVKHTKTWVPDV